MTLAQMIVLAIAVVFLMLLVLVLKKLAGGEGRLPYYSKQCLLSRGETAFYHALQRSLPAHLIICPKVRLSDLVGCSAEAWKAGYGGRISQKHVDFVLADTDTTAIALVIELDDRSHAADARRQRDDFVDRVFKSASIPMLRVPAAASYDVRALRDLIASRTAPATSAPVPATARQR